MPKGGQTSSSKAQKGNNNVTDDDTELTQAELEEVRKQAELVKKRRAMVDGMGDARDEEAVVEAEVERVVGRCGLLRRVLVEVGTTTVVLVASVIMIGLLLASSNTVADNLIDRELSAASTPARLGIETWYARRYGSYNLLRLSVMTGVFEGGDWFTYSQLFFGAWLTDSSVVSLNMMRPNTDNYFMAFTDASGSILGVQRLDANESFRFQFTTFTGSNFDFANSTRWPFYPDAALAALPAQLQPLLGQALVVDPATSPWVQAANRTRAPLSQLIELDYDLADTVVLWSPAVRVAEDVDTLTLMYRADYPVVDELTGFPTGVFRPYYFAQTFTITSLVLTLQSYNALPAGAAEEDTILVLVDKFTGDVIAHPNATEAVNADEASTRKKLWDVKGFEELSLSQLAVLGTEQQRVDSENGEIAYVLTPLATYSYSVLVVRTTIEDIVPEEVEQLRLLVIISLIIIVLMLMRIVFSIYVVIREYNLLLQVVRAGVETKRAEMQALDLAEKEAASNAAKTRFVSVMSHELRTPLTGVVMNTDMLQATEMDEQQSAYVGGIAESSSMLLSILNDVLDLTKLEARKVELERRPCSLYNIVEGQVHAHTATAYAKDIEVFSFVPLTVPPAVIIDEHRLRQVIGNLLSNAIKFTREGCVSVQVVYKGPVVAGADDNDVQHGEHFGDALTGGDIESKGPTLPPPSASVDTEASQLAVPRGGSAAGGARTPRGGGGKSPRQSRIGVGDATRKHKLRFEVIDTGPGIDDAGKERLFKEFSQVDQSTTREYGGTGLGLFVCKEIVQLMGGKIGVKSELGVGSTFWFELDVLEAVDDDFITSNVKPLPTMQPFDTPSDPLNVCIASDDPALRKLLVKYVYEMFPDAKNAMDGGMGGDEGLMVRVREASNASKVLKWLKERDTHKNVQMDGSQWVLIASDTLESEKLSKAIDDYSTHKKDDYFVLLGPELSKKASAALHKQGWSHTLVRPLRVARMHTLFAKVVGDEQGFREGSTTPGSSGSGTAASGGVRRASGHSSRSDGGGRGGRGGGGGGGEGVDDADRPTVLIVDDFLMMRDLMTKALQNLGFATRTAANGQIAVDAVMHKKFAFILMDCEMPVMDGYEATRKIRELEAKSSMKRTPIIACTANAMREDRRKTMDCGMDDFLAKPVSNDALKSIVAKYTEDANEEKKRKKKEKKAAATAAAAEADS